MSLELGSDSERLRRYGCFNYRLDGKKNYLWKKSTIQGSILKKLEKSLHCTEQYIVHWTYRQKWLHYMLNVVSNCTKWPLSAGMHRHSRLTTERVTVRKTAALLTHFASSTVRWNSSSLVSTLRSYTMFSMFPQHGYLTGWEAVTAVASFT
jgi:hypothetical protein